MIDVLMHGILIFLAVLIYPLRVSEGDEGKTRVLIIDGYSNHDWRYTTEVIYSILMTLIFLRSILKPHLCLMIRADFHGPTPMRAGLIYDETFIRFRDILIKEY